MAKDNVGAILTFDADNIRYITSYYVTDTHAGHQSIRLPLSHETVSRT